MKKYFFFLLLILFLFSCGNGPAEDRGDTNCRNAILFSLAIFDRISDPQKMSSLSENKEGNFILLYEYNKLTCSAHDSLLDRYYRGYVLGKE